MVHGDPELLLSKIWITPTQTFFVGVIILPPSQKEHVTYDLRLMHMPRSKSKDSQI